jgi:hypothetical protein
MTRKIALPNLSALKNWTFWIFNLILPLLFFGVAQGIVPTHGIFQFNPDEGIELTKVDLYRQGYVLYQQIWNDQPPLPTVLWSVWLEKMGSTLATARLLTLLFATGLIWAFGHCIRLTVGVIPAIAGVILLSNSVHFMTLSHAVMMGIPALAMVMGSTYGLLLYQRSAFLLRKKAGNITFLVASSIAFAVALQIKSYVAFLVPVFLLSLYLSLKQKALLRSHWQDMAVWLMGVGIATYGISLTLPLPDFSQTLGGHFNQELGQSESWLLGLRDFVELFLYDVDLLALCGLTAILLPKSRRNFPIFPLLWLLLASITLLIHRPIWSHYSMLISIPVIWLATYALQQIAMVLWSDYDSRRNQREGIFAQTKVPHLHLRPIKILLLCVCLSLLLLPLKGWLTYTKVQDLMAESRIYQTVLQSVRLHHSQTHWLFTDLPMFAFQSNLKVPPEIAVFSQKRLRSQKLTQPYLTEIFNRYQPEQVLLGRFPEIEAGLKPTLNNRYTDPDAKKNVTLYLRKDLAESFQESQY